MKYQIKYIDVNQYKIACNIYKNEQGEFQTINGSINRYNFYDSDGNLINNDKILSIFILGKTLDKKYFFVTDGNKIAKINEKDLIKLCVDNKMKISNGKIINNSYISSILDEYDVIKNQQTFELYENDELIKYINKNIPKFVHSERNSIKDLNNYINSAETGKICILYGLRRTGKTILLLQLAKKLLLQNKKGVYIICNSLTNIQELKTTLKDLSAKENDFIFIDEITYVKGFYENSNIISDCVAIGKTKVILSGTDSLIFSLASSTLLYDRYKKVDTTYINYKEYCELIGNLDILKYLRIGGTLQADTFYNETHNYIKTSIIDNIIHTINNIKEDNTYPNIKYLAQKDEKLLRKAIFQLLIYENSEILYSTINSEFILPEFETTFNLMAGYIHQFGEEQKEELYKELITKYNIEMNTSKQIINSSIIELLEILQDINVIVKYQKRFRKSGSKDLSIVDAYLFNQPGLRYSLTEDLIKSIYKKFSTEDINKLNQFEKRLRYYLEGGLLEHLIINNFIYNYRNNKDYEITQITRNPGEYDVAIINKLTNTVDVYEVKRSDEPKKEWAQWMNNQDFINYVQSQINYNLNNKLVLYNGNDTVVDNIPYKNISKYLKEL